MRHYLTKQAMKAVKASVVMLTFFGLAGTAMADKKITFKTPSAFGTNLPITGSTSVYFADVLEKVSGGNMKIKMFEPGELMPAFDIHQAVSDGQVQAGTPAVLIWWFFERSYSILYNAIWTRTSRNARLVI